MPSIENRGQSIFFEDQGSGPCVVLGHSFLCSGAMWRYQVPRLAEEHRVLNLDLRGHGRSAAVELPTSVRELVDDVLAVLDHLEIERAVWAGLSIGGMVALRAALWHPERVRALVLLGTHAGSDSFYRRLKYRTLGMGTRLLGMRRLLPGVTPLMFGRTTRRQKRRLVAEWEEIIAGAHVPSLLRILEALTGRESIVDRLPEIEVPSLVMVGDEDRALPPAFSREIAAGLSDAELVVVPQSGHLAALEQPEIVTGAMLEFLARFDRRR